MIDYCWDARDERYVHIQASCFHPLLIIIFSKEEIEYLDGLLVA